MHAAYLRGHVCREALQQRAEGQHAVEQGHQAACRRDKLAVQDRVQRVEGDRLPHLLLQALRGAACQSSRNQKWVLQQTKNHQLI
jgi:hypothetical protein